MNRWKCFVTSVIYIAVNLVFHERMKHIESEYHSVREEVKDRIITTPHVWTTGQLDDIMTKALAEVRHLVTYCPSWTYVTYTLQLEGVC